MKKVSLIVSDTYLNNKIFDIDNAFLNRDNCLYFFFLLKKFFFEQGFELCTQDINVPEHSDIIIFNDIIENKLIKKVRCSKKYLMMFESVVIKPQNWNTDNHKSFDAVFTWNDDIVDNIKYFKFNFSNKILIKKDYFNKKIKTGFVCIISGNKKVNHSLELYSEREKFIKWFDRKHPDELDLYGISWDKLVFSGIFRVFNKLKISRKLFGIEYRSYKGKIDTKLPVMAKYKFAICFENAKDISGYITEKIFDCFFAGCVPVYLGAKNISEHIPEDCFIDFRKFRNYEELYDYLKDMNETVYESYLNNILNFIKSSNIRQFDAKYNAQNIIRKILDDING